MGPRCNHMYPYKREAKGDLTSKKKGKVTTSAEGERQTQTEGERFEDTMLQSL